MKLTRVYVRFFRSFNFDYERKARQGATVHDWEKTPEGWYPFVRLEVDDRITAVVGANESGKSHLLDAVEALLTEVPVVRQDFCRYSDLYSVEEGERRVSDFAGLFAIESDDDAALMSSLGYVDQGELYYVRSGSGESFVFTHNSPKQRPLSAEEQKQLRALFPQVFRLKTEVALPASMSVRRLAGGGKTVVDALPARSHHLEILSTLPDPGEDTEVKPWLKKVTEWVTPKRDSSGESSVEAQRREEEFQLGCRLLLDVARIDQRSFGDLQKALAAEHEGEVNALIARMNAAIAKYLNFPKWWAQDQDFELLLSPREHEVAFTVRDRTDTEYSFTERSRGLRYFLSYYVQLRANTSPPGRRQLLLLDEPDAYLSGIGQQDLLRILEDFARPDSGDNPAQVMYVTHSPYLINRNAAHRIRVLDKGSQDDGTRVVTDASQNHYEPLRSALGPFVAETAFIGGSNLFVEGLADQVLLAGVSSHLLARGAAPSQTLNLNDVTIVPAGSASEIPYLVYLARGRGHIKPPCVVLLDSDKSGQEADKKLRRNPVGRRAYINADYIVTVDSWASKAGVAPSVTPGVTLEEPEDLIALPVAAAAVRSFARDMLGLSDREVESFTDGSIAAHVVTTGHVWDAVEAAVEDVFPGEHIEKVAFAREVVAALNSAEAGKGGQLEQAAATTRENFTSLLTHLADKLRDARNSEDDKQQRDRVKRLVDNFLRDHPDGCQRDLVRVLFHDVELALEDTDAGDARRGTLSRMRREYEIDREPLSQVPRWDDFKQELRGLPIQERLANQNQLPDALATGAASETVDTAAAAGESAVPDASSNDGGSAPDAQRELADVAVGGEDVAEPAPTAQASDDANSSTAPTVSSEQAPPTAGGA